MAVEQDGDRAHIAQDAGHVGGCRERADLQRPVDESMSAASSRVDVDPAVAVLVDHDRSASDSRHGSSLLWCS